MKRLTACSMCLGLALAMGACGGESRLTLLLTDAPPDTEAMASAVVTLARVEAHFAGDDATDAGEKDAGWREISGAPQSYDLLKLQNGVTAAIGELALPPGKVTQIRLFIDPAGPNVITLQSGATCALDLSNVDHTGVKIAHPFEIGDGSHVTVVLDFDVRESVAKDGECAYRLNPVVKVKSIH